MFEKIKNWWKVNKDYEEHMKTLDRAVAFIDQQKRATPPLSAEETLAQALTIEEKKEDIDDLLVSLDPILLERGRRVFGNLKQSKPKTVLVEVENLPYDATMVLSPAPGGHLIRAYVVESIVDIRCLSMALSYSKTEPCRDYLSTDIDVVINGVPVIPAEDVKGKS